MCLDLERHSLDVEFLRFRRHQDNTTAVWPRVETGHHSVSRYSLTKYICSHLQIFLRCLQIQQRGRGVQHGDDQHERDCVAHGHGDLAQPRHVQVLL